MLTQFSSLPLFGSAVIVMIMLAAAYTFIISVQAGSRSTVRALQSARFGVYGTVALIAVAVLTLAYAFVSHDYRLRYVSHYSDRGMPTVFLFTALWGGQDGSLLWWLFLLSLYIGACVRWLGVKHIQLQPYVIATLMSVVIFFCVLMIFAANPFSTSVSGARNDGEGLNPLLQNFYMIIHPPSLYVGFVGCTVPFAFAMAALITGRLDIEWIKASRKWMLFPWLFLAIGNTLGMLWAYEELGWGGYWAWDPVENAAFMPFLVATAYLHSVMIQERRGMLKVWNMALVCLTFFMTIFGTFLTRSGTIASVHSFAQSSIGQYFVWYLGLFFVVVFSLIMWRWPELRDLPKRIEYRKAALFAGWIIVASMTPGIYLVVSKANLPSGVGIAIFAATAGAGAYAGLELVFRRMTANVPAEEKKRPQFESTLSREFTFMLNNWALLAFMGFVLVATTFPMISEAIWGEKVTVGPPYYNAWIQPLGLIIFILMGVGTLFGWKKTSTEAFRRACIAPVVATVVAVVLHFAIGEKIGFPAIVWGDTIYAGALGQGLHGLNAAMPFMGIAVTVFNMVVVVQEFVWLFKARAKSGASKATPNLLYFAGILPGFFHTMFTLPPASRRRYGGYIVHFGLIVMLFGFTGQSWNISKETALSPGQSYALGDYSVEYKGPRMEVDTAKRAIYADLEVKKNGVLLGKAEPAKFIYKKMPESPTTEVSMLHTLRDDIYLVVGNIDPTTKIATFQLHLNPLVSWIWFGCLILILGSVLCMWPELEPQESRVWQFARGAAATAGAVSIGILLALMPTQAFALQTSSLHAGTVKIEDAKEREIFAGLRCMCGTCARDPLSTCACGSAEEARQKIRTKIKAGETRDAILQSYAAEYGMASLSVPPNKGAMGAIYMVPLGGGLAAAIALGLMIRKWRKNEAGAKAAVAGDNKDGYDDRLDQELKDLEG
jgi:cytochrome c-type biogenesis protein CcmF